MRIGWTHPVQSPTPTKIGRKTQDTSSPSHSFEMEPSLSHSNETGSAYGPAGNNSPPQQSDIQIKNYMMTVLFRQNWSENTSHFGAHGLPTRPGFDNQDYSYWQPEKVAQRVISFAKAVADKEPSTIDRLKSSALQGLDNAEKMLGNTVPLQQTREFVLQAFEDWKNEQPS